MQTANACATSGQSDVERFGRELSLQGCCAQGAASGFEFGFVLFATLFGLAVLVWSYRRHRAMRALWLLIPGLAVLWIGILYPPLHHSVVPHAVAMTFGGTLVGLAHLANLRLNHGHVHDATCAHGH